MARLLWISDAGRTTGFSRATHAIAERLVENYGHDIHVLAVGYEAEQPNRSPLQLYRSEAGPARSYLGMDRVVPLLLALDPDVVFVLEDPTILYRRIFENQFDQQHVLRRYRSIMAYLPVDGYSLPPKLLELTKATNVIAMSKFGQAAFPGSQLVYHAADPAIFHEPSPENPVITRHGPLTSKEECREAYRIPKDAFVVGRVDTNSGRKDWPATWRAIERYAEFKGNPETVAFFHTKLANPGHGVDLQALMTRSSKKVKYMISNATDWTIGDVVALQNTFNVVLTTSRGEGAGLGNIEAMACGVPVIATDCSAITEYVGPGGILTAPLAPWTNPYGIDLMLANTDAMANALHILATKPKTRELLGARAREHVLTNFNWDVETAKVNKLINALA